MYNHKLGGANHLALPPSGSPCLALKRVCASSDPGQKKVFFLWSCWNHKKGTLPLINMETDRGVLEDHFPFKGNPLVWFHVKL